MLSSLLCALAVKTQKYFPNFRPKRVIAGNQATRYYHRWLEIRINLLMNVESKYCDDCNISVKAVTHYRVIRRYFANFLLQAGSLWNLSPIGPFLIGNEPNVGRMFAI